MREMRQSAWLNTSFFTLQGTEGKSQCEGARSLWLVWSVWFIWLVSFNETHETDRIDQIDRTDQMNKTDWRLEVLDLPINRSQPCLGKVSIDLRKTSAAKKLSD